ncbi:MAG: sulfurtransferase TusA family protein [Elusimicrobiales bacterium]|nr:sulfurtransferase TusA family protein [Elusimicrobiales bacterium]
MDLSQVKAAKTVDARSMACPGPLLEAKKGIAGVPVGGVLEIQSGDKGSREDIPAWCAKSGHEYLGVLERDGYDSLFVTRKK